MKKRSLLAGVAAAALLAAAPAYLAAPTLAPIQAAQAQNVEIGVFVDGLSDHGRWHDHGRYGQVFIPANVGQDWRPYRDGHWIYTDEYGWYWQSDEPFAWATYHYGNWTVDRELGWVWVPGKVWAPAWVDWRYGEGHVGWAPRPPRHRWDGTAIEVSFNIVEEPDYWYFVRDRHFAARDLRQYYIVDDRPTIFRNASYYGTPVIHRDRVVNDFISFNFIVNVSDDDVDRRRIRFDRDRRDGRDGRDGRDRRDGRDGRDGGEIEAFRPIEADARQAAEQESLPTQEAALEQQGRISREGEVVKGEEARAIAAEEEQANEGRAAERGDGEQRERGEQQAEEGEQRERGEQQAEEAREQEARPQQEQPRQRGENRPQQQQGEPAQRGEAQPPQRERRGEARPQGDGGDARPQARQEQPQPKEEEEQRRQPRS